ncbi:MAG: gamma carbonic anhydrase family protein [Deltaproteobacteria bacterium]|nr:gamma carbonic anhydrase family protein [Deltaproteobacteria bacterium]
MAIYQYGDRIPKISNDSFVSDTAVVIGDVAIGTHCYIGHGAILRGDYGTIKIGDGTAVEENAVLHIRPDGLLELEEKVTVGHGALVHGKLMKDHAVIGIGAVIGFDVVVGRWSIVAEGCVVPKGKIIPDGKIAAGTPYRIIGDTLEKHKAFWTYGKQLYIDLAKEYPQKFKRIG